jgi:hypothetical protein
MQSASVSDDITEGQQAIAVNPDTIGIKPPTRGHLCGRSSGSADHRRRGERSCQECLDAAASDNVRWERAREQKLEDTMAARAATRPSLEVLLRSHGVDEPEAAAESLRSHGYGDYADALLEAAKACPIPTSNRTTGGNVKSWLRGRAHIIQKAL